MNSRILESIDQHIELAKVVRADLVTKIDEVSKSLVAAIGNGKSIFWCGNGGSAADSQHLAAELIGRFKEERPAIASIALTTDTSILTCLGNDYGYESIFRRQLSGLAKKNDILMCLSTSGNSGNVVEAALEARKLGVNTVGLLGNDGGRLSDLCDQALIVPSNDTAHIQEMHIMIGHILCGIVEVSVAHA